MTPKCKECGMTIRSQTAHRTGLLCIHCYNQKKTMEKELQERKQQERIISRKEKEEREKQLHAERIVNLEHSLKNGIIGAKSKIKHLASPHLATLAKKKKRLITIDDYRNSITDKWNKEVDYFYNRVLGSNSEFQVLTTALIKTQAELSVHNLNYEFPPITFCKYLNSIIDIEMEQTENLSPEYSNDITPEDYEHYCANILSTAGWTAFVTKGSGDQGIDVVAEKGNVRLAIQCKKYSKPVGNKAVQEAYSGGAFYEANACAVVAPIEYTPSAIELADSLGVHLFHHDDLADLSITTSEEV